MEYPETLEQANEYAAEALKLMEEIGIPPNPNNYTIWFHYFSGKYPDLKRTLDILLDNRQEFTETRNTEIFQKFFTLDQESTTLHDATTRAESELGRIIGNLHESTEDVRGYGKDLATFSGTLDTNMAKGELRELVAGITARTNEMEGLNQRLEEKLEASGKEIRELKEDLERMRREAMTDGLTGIANRKLFDLELRKAAMNAMANGEELSLMMLDIDHFGNFNEEYGHQVGDQVLKLVAVTISESIKGQDTAARYGGEEFAVILPRTNLENAVRLGQHICKRVSAKNIVNRATGERMGKITMSAGIALFHYGEPVSQLIVRSDKALLQAKDDGRNMVLSQDSLPDT